MSTHRLFTAIRVPEPIAVDLCARVRTALGDERSFRMPRSDALHLTVHFHGDVETERVDTLATELGSSLSGASGCVLEFCGTGAFPRRGAERVLWVAARVTEGASLGPLRTAVLSGAEAAGFDTARERERPFLPHVTVARPRALGRRRPQVSSAFYGLELCQRFRVEEIALIESVPLSGGAHRYDTLRGYSSL